MQGPRQGLLSDVSETSGRRRGLPSQRTEAQMNKTKPKDCGEAQTETGEALKGPKPHNLSEEKQVHPRARPAKSVRLTNRSVRSRTPTIARKAALANHKAHASSPRSRAGSVGHEYESET
jgi:hypothetical protein